MIYPNLYIVGVHKCGTTTLHDTLSRHPDIHMSENKEPHFHISDLVKDYIPNCISTLSSYEALFSGTEAIVKGESSVLYSYFYEEAIRNITSTSGKDSKIIILLRNPIDRAYSAYIDVSTKNNLERETFKQAIEKGNARKTQNLNPTMQYKDMGLYFEKVMAFKNSFPNVKIITTDELASNQDELISSICSFLNISYNSNYFRQSNSSNVGGKIWKYSAFNNFINTFFNSSFRNKLKLNYPRTHKSLKSFATNLLMKKSPSMDNKTRSELIEYYKDDINKLSTLLNKNLDHWLK